MRYTILHILCEGQTEERFVKEVLSPYLRQFNIPESDITSHFKEEEYPGTVC